MNYDPVECLRAEVKRFQSTNTFNPMQVTGFYIQATVVLDILDRLRKEHETVMGSKTLKLAAEVARARQADIVRLENEVADLKALVMHAELHENYEHCGFREMTTEQKKLYIDIIKDDFTGTAEYLSRYITS